ncbi:MAG: V-type ATPase subunit [Infirmifilum sp.]|jgi:vacuolar-type H+-ATPase subunit C/Vma6|uniref:V-type ATPase subunit n=1 Tax=Infirmifilum TaxID=2856573 RepID=UPI00235515ED
METYAAVRAHGLKSRLLSRGDYEDILKGEKKLSDFKDYSSILDTDALDAKLEKIYRVYVSRLETISKAGPEISGFVLALLDKLEVENIKIHLRYILGAQRPVIYYPYGRHLGPAKLSTIKTEGMLWEALSRTVYQAPSSPNFTTPLESERELLLDLLYYNYLLRKVEELKVSNDSKEALQNLIREELEKKILVWSRVIDSSIIFKLASSLRFRVRIPGIPDDWKNLKTTELMQNVEMSLLKDIEVKISLRFPVSIGFVYYYNALAFLEARNLEKIIIGKELGFPEEVILRNLILV